RSQLVRHVGEELVLVAGGERQLLGLLLQLLARQLDLPVLPLHFAVLLGELARFLLQLLVGLLELFLLLPKLLFGSLERYRLLFQPAVRLLKLLLLVLKFQGERLGLLEKLLGPHVRRERVEDDADALRELVKEGEVDLAEAIERRQ